MSRYRKILLIVDSTPRETPAWHRAVSLAHASGAELHLCLFGYSSAVAASALISSRVSEMAKWAFTEQRERWLRERADKLKAQGMNIRAEVIWGGPLQDRMIEKIVALQPDLVVKDAHLEPLLKRVLFTPLDWHLLRLCPVPLLMVRRSRNKLPRTVVAAVDTANPLPNAANVNDRIVDAASALAAECGAKLHLVHSFEDLLPVVPGEVMSEAAFNDAFEKLRKIHRQRFDEFADRYAAPHENRHFIIGPSAYALAEFARELPAQVLVLGTTHRTGIDRIVIGSTAENILPDVRCDVLAVKPEGLVNDLKTEFQYEGRQAGSGRGREQAPLKVG